MLLAALQRRESAAKDGRSSSLSLQHRAPAFDILPSHGLALRHAHHCEMDILTPPTADGLAALPSARPPLHATSGAPAMRSSMTSTALADFGYGSASTARPTNAFHGLVAWFSNAVHPTAVYTWSKSRRHRKDASLHVLFPQLCIKESWQAYLPLNQGNIPST